MTPPGSTLAVIQQQSRFNAVRIAFLCISLEPGRDGVGDYVRQFAGHLTRAGHICQVLALADPFVTQPVKSLDPTDGYEIARQPLALWNGGDTRWAEEALARFAPDWVSLQMVCYGFESRGLLMKSGRLFEKLGRFGNRHVMFHELWIGESAGADLRTRALGGLQRRLLLRAIKRWAPRSAHTSNGVYRELLGRAGINAGLLPLPGNVPVASNVTPREARSWLLDKLGLRDETALPLLVAGVFGSIHPEWRDSRWLDAFSGWAQQLGRKPVVLQIGRAGRSGEAVWKSLCQQFGGRVEMHALGELDAADVSRALLALDFGVAASPWALIGKSGAAAAMLDHGLPVVVTRDDFDLRNGPTPEPEAHPLLVRYAGPQTFSQLDGLKHAQASNRSPDVYRTFLESLPA
jgi:hypothetical protein